MAELFHRVSIRKYKDKPVEKEKILQIIKAGMQAPSAGNQHPWEFYVVTDKETLKALAKTSPYAGTVGNAPAAIVTAYHKECQMPEYAQIDLSIAMENMWLMTDEIGLGGVWLEIAPLEDRMKTVEKVLNLPDTVRAFGIFALGYPDETREQQDRFKEDRIHFAGNR